MLFWQLTTIKCVVCCVDFLEKYVKLKDFCSDSAARVIINHRKLIPGFLLHARMVL